MTAVETSAGVPPVVADVPSAQMPRIPQNA
jgi:hypothetical protein